MTRPDVASPTARTAVVFGARNLGRAVIDALVADGWAVTGVARSQSTLDGITAAGARAVARRHHRSGERARDGQRGRRGARRRRSRGQRRRGVRGRSPGPFGGGPIAQAGADAFDSWAAAPARSAFAFLSGAGAVVAAQGRPATLIQVTGGSSRRAMAGRGLWAAGAFGVRAITQAAALELRAQGIHVALLIIDAGIEPIDGTTREGVDPRRACRPPLARRGRAVPRRPGRAVGDP